MNGERKSSKMGRPPRTPGEKPTRERILDAAVDLFAENGYDRTSIRQIAKAVCLTESAIYRHFPGKEALLNEIFSYAEQQIYTPLPVEETLGTKNGDSIFRGLLSPLPAIMATESYIIKIMRIMYAEIHHNPKINEYYRREYVERADDYLEELFNRCVALGEIKACDTRSLARIFNAFRSEWSFQICILREQEFPDIDAMERDLEGPIRFFEQLLVPKDRGNIS